MSLFLKTLQNTLKWFYFGYVLIDMRWKYNGYEQDVMDGYNWFMRNCESDMDIVIKSHAWL